MEGEILDKWHGNESLCTSFPSHFAIVASKEVWVVDVWTCQMEVVVASHFSWLLNDWEVDIWSVSS